MENFNTLPALAIIILAIFVIGLLYGLLKQEKYIKDLEEDILYLQIREEDKDELNDHQEKELANRLGIINDLEKENRSLEKESLGFTLELAERFGIFVKIEVKDGTKVSMYKYPNNTNKGTVSDFCRNSKDVNEFVKYYCREFFPENGINEYFKSKGCDL